MSSSFSGQYKAIRLAPMALLMTRSTDFPYEEWFLRATANNKARLDVKGKRLNFPFFIEDNKVMLDLEIPEFSHMNRVACKPNEILFELQRCGILIMPEDRDGEAEGIDIKDEMAEERAILDISLSVSAFAFRNSTWNR